MKTKKVQSGLLFPALLCTLLWGSAFPSVKSGYLLFGVEDTFTKFLFAGFRFTGAGIAVLLVARLLMKRSVRPRRQQWKGILALGLVQTTLQYVFFYVGLSNTTGVKGSVLTATTTFISVILAHFLFRDDRINAVKAIGCIIGFVGVVVVNLGTGDLGGGFRFTGEGFMMISAAAAAFGALISKVVAKGEDPMLITGWQLTFGGGILLLMGAAGGGHFSNVEPKGIALLCYMIFLSAAAFTIWTMLLAKYPVGKVTVYNFLVPVFGTLMSGLILHEAVFTPYNLCALVLVCIGITLVNRVKTE
ncbi:MAG: DMT family transporter [Butyricicoccaceae bacterium]